MNRVIKKIRAWLVAIVREGTKPMEKKKLMSGHSQLVRLQAARSLMRDGVSVNEAAVILGIEPQDLEYFLSPRAARRP
jgi:hypothetical protein